MNAHALRAQATKTIMPRPPAPTKSPSQRFDLPSKRFKMAFNAVQSLNTEVANPTASFFASAVERSFFGDGRSSPLLNRQHLQPSP